MKKLVLSGFFILSFLPVFAGGQQETDTELTVFIAASTTDVITDIAGLYEEKSGISVNINPASSGTLAKQIEQGAPADVYISASEKWMEYVKGLDVTEKSASLVTNRLVLIVPEESKLKTVSFDGSFSLADLFEGHLSMGDPEHVPAGKYAKEAITYYGWYENLESRILPAADVRAALSVVELSEADLGIVYETDARKSDKVRILSGFPEESHTPIQYFCALLKDSSDEAGDFYDFLLNDANAKELFKSYGFTVRN
jgi:molybdate transport system substrate-binding protein